MNKFYYGLAIIATTLATSFNVSRAQDICIEEVEPCIEEVEPCYEEVYEESSYLEYFDEANIQFINFYAGMAILGIVEGNDQIAIRARAIAEFIAAGDNETLSRAYQMSGEMFHEMDEWEKCYVGMNIAMEYNSENDNLLNNYAYFLSLQNKDMDKALDMIERALEVDPYNPFYLDTYGWVLHVLGRDTEAVEVMKRAEPLVVEKLGEFYFHYGDILYELGDDRAARKYWRKAGNEGWDEDVIDDRFERPTAKKRKTKNE